MSTTAVRESYDRQNGWSRGFVWVRQGALPGTLTGIFLHELGHILGCDHVQSTIMDEKRLAKLLYESHFKDTEDLNRARERKLTQIDGPRSLHNPLEAFIPTEGHILEKDQEETFTRFFGRSSSGKISGSARFELVEKERRAYVVIELRDDLGSGVIRMPVLSGKSFEDVMMQTPQKIFYVLTKGNGTHHFVDLGSTHLVQVTDASGVNYTAMVSLNMIRQLEVTYVVSDRTVNLFRSQFSVWDRDEW